MAIPNEIDDIDEIILTEAEEDRIGKEIDDIVERRKSINERIGNLAWEMAWRGTSAPISILGVILKEMNELQSEDNGLRRKLRDISENHPDF